MTRDQYGARAARLAARRPNVTQSDAARRAAVRAAVRTARNGRSVDGPARHLAAGGVAQGDLFGDPLAAPGADPTRRSVDGAGWPGRPTVAGVTRTFTRWDR